MIGDKAAEVAVEEKEMREKEEKEETLKRNF